MTEFNIYKNNWIKGTGKAEISSSSKLLHCTQGRNGFSSVALVLVLDLHEHLDQQMSVFVSASFCT